MQKFLNACTSVKRGGYYFSFNSALAAVALLDAALPLAAVALLDVALLKLLLLI